MKFIPAKKKAGGGEGGTGFSHAEGGWGGGGRYTKFWGSFL